jgi:8-hydroxy-5-deazaflavin:NADPH oxidoreductase
MRIAVLGTGVAGRTVAGGLARLGHDVVVGTRDPAATRDRDDWDDGLALAEYATVADGADLVVNATNGLASLAALEAVGADGLAGRVILDLANPLDFSAGFPPTLAVKDTDSLAEQIQRAFPDARVVKALNTVNAQVMMDPAKVGEGDTTIFAASDDAEARALVVGLLRELGWRDVVEFDELSAARGLEMWLPLWVRLMRRLATPDFNIKVVR